MGEGLTRVGLLNRYFIVKLAEVMIFIDYISI